MRFFTLLLCFLVWSLSTSPISAATWSDTDPTLNLTHIFEGEINARGKAVGFHARPFGRDPDNAVLEDIIAGPNRLGIYTGRAEIYDTQEDRWRAKAFSSFFPDQMTREKIIALILEAFHSTTPSSRGKWRGATAAGFAIEGWLCPKGGTPNCPEGAVNTAYPIYRAD